MLFVIQMETNLARISKNRDVDAQVAMDNSFFLFFF